MVADELPPGAGHRRRESAWTQGCWETSTSRGRANLYLGTACLDLQRETVATDTGSDRCNPCACHVAQCVTLGGGGVSEENGRRRRRRRRGEGRDGVGWRKGRKGGGKTHRTSKSTSFAFPFPFSVLLLFPWKEERTHFSVAHTRLSFVCTQRANRPTEFQNMTQTVHTKMHNTSDQWCLLQTIILTCTMAYAQMFESSAVATYV